MIIPAVRRGLLLEAAVSLYFRAGFYAGFESEKGNFQGIRFIRTRRNTLK
jgi:hypothetical protein